MADKEFPIIEVLTESCYPNEWNPNIQSDFIYQRVIRSIKEFGFIDPITVREVDGQYEIIDGYHRWQAAQELKLPHVLVTNLGEMSEEAAKQLTIILNKTRGEADPVDLGKLVQETIDTVGREQAEYLLPLDSDQIDHLTEALEFDWNDFDDYSDELESDEAEWVTLEIAIREDDLPVVASEFDRIGDVMNVNQELPEGVQRGLILEKICVLSAQEGE